MWLLGLLLSVAWGLTSRLDWGLPAQLDILFAEPDRTSLENIQQAFKQDLGLDITFGGVPDGVTDNDGYLGRVLADHGVVGARYFYFDHVSKSDTPQKPEFRFDGRLDLLSLNDAPGLLNNTAPIASQLRFSGFLNTQRDRDGMLRRVPMLIQHDGVLYPHLSLATFLRSQGLDSATIAEDRFGPVIQAGRHAIPIDEHGYLLLRFNGPPDLYPAVSAVDVLNGTVDPAALANKIVFVGSSAAALNDLHGTVFDVQFPGLKLQSVIADNILAGHFARELPSADNAILLLRIAMGAVLTLMFIQYADTLFLSLAAFAMVGLTVAACAYLFHATGIFLLPAAPVTLTAWPGRREHPVVGAHHVRGRRLRRVDQPALLQTTVFARRIDGDHAQVARHHVRPGGVRCIRQHRTRDPDYRCALPGRYRAGGGGSLALLAQLHQNSRCSRWRQGAFAPPPKKA